MKIQVKVKPNAKVPEIIETSSGCYTVKVNAKPVDGSANIRLIEMLAMHFHVPFGLVRIMSGAKGRDKLIEIIGL
jgi:hypothetical protein